MPIDLLPLVELTNLPKVWKIFSDVISVSAPTDYGYSLDLLGTYLKSYGDLPVSHDEFWLAMRIFTNDLNRRLAVERKKSPKK